MRSVEAWAAVVAMAAVAGCGADPSESTDLSEGTRAALAASPQARSRIEALRERFRLTLRYDGAASGPKPKALAGPDAKPTPVIGAGIATAFEPSGTERESVRALIPSEAKRGVARTASVELPRAATGFARLEDDASHLSVRFALLDAKDAPIAVSDGMALYAGALADADVVHRAHAEGTEDFVVFEEQPAREELSYRVDVSRVAGLRLVSNTLEFLDDAGSPRLRVAPPYVVDAVGERHEAKLAVEGCAYDVNPAAPWGRPVTSPRATWCKVRVAWEGVPYPAVVDPAWTATGSMAEARSGHTASVLASGNVLVAGGRSSGGVGTVIEVATAELYDPAAGTFSATGSMADARSGHTASVLGSGKVLISGGVRAGYLATAELYDPVAGTFSAAGSMAEARYAHTASVLGSGKVLIAGGHNHFVVATAELYDPAVGTFSAAGAMAEARSEHTASVLGSGNVLVAGGPAGIGTADYLASAELYDLSAPEPQPEGGAGTSSGGTSGTTGGTGPGGTSGSGGTGGITGGTGPGGTSGASGSAGSVSGGSSGNAASGDGGGESSGCGCRAASGAPSGSAFGLALAALLGLRRRRRSL